MATEQLPIKITHFYRKAEAPKTVFPTSGIGEELV